MEEYLAFDGSSKLTYQLLVDDNVMHPTSYFDDGILQVKLPKKEATTWMNTNQVGIEHEHEIDNGERMHLLIEKDFPCIDREDEDKEDTFQELAEENDATC